MTLSVVRRSDKQHNISLYSETKNLATSLKDLGIQCETYLRSLHFRQREMVLALPAYMLVGLELVGGAKLDILESGMQKRAVAKLG